MTRLFASKSWGILKPCGQTSHQGVGDDEEESSNPTSTPFISHPEKGNGHHFAIMGILLATLRKSLATCGGSKENDSAADIWPTDVRHESHVILDRLNGFLGLPSELQPEVSKKVSGASTSILGASPQSKQCHYDVKENSVPTILLMMQSRLYAKGGLKTEGIFRINAEYGEEEYVRKQLNKGIIPFEVDVHCLAGLIKAWLRELPRGLLDSLTPEQVRHCNTEDDCIQLARLLPPTGAALFDWAVNLMADVVQHEEYNKMNAHNIAMVFAPNMTQMGDSTNALIHAMQVIKFLKILILKTLKERNAFAAKNRKLSSWADSSTKIYPCQANSRGARSYEQIVEPSSSQEYDNPKLEKGNCRGLESNTSDDDWSSGDMSDIDEELEPVLGGIIPLCKAGDAEYGHRNRYNCGDWLNLRSNVRRFCRRPVSKSSKRTRGLMSNCK